MLRCFNVCPVFGFQFSYIGISAVDLRPDLHFHQAHFLLLHPLADICLFNQLNVGKLITQLQFKLILQQIVRH